MHAGADPLDRGAEEPRHAQVRDEHHHAEEQHQRPEVDVVVRLVERDDAGGDHQRRADDRGARPVDSQVGCASDGQDEIGEEEDGARDDREEHAGGSYIGDWAGSRPVHRTDRAGRGFPVPAVARGLANPLNLGFS